LNRREYLQEQRKQGRRILGVFPAHYPKEILWAAGTVPAEIWDPPLKPGRARAHLQPYICSVVQQGLELVLSPLADQVDGFLIPHTCDSIQNTASMIQDYLDPGKPLFFFQHPRAPYRASSKEYYRAQLENLARELGPLDSGELARAIAQGTGIDRLLHRLWEDRAQGGGGLSNLELYRLLRRGEWLWPEDHRAELEEALAGGKGPPEGGPGTSRAAVVLSGVLPPSEDLLVLMDRLGLKVGGDDLLACGRRLPEMDDREEAAGGDGLELLAQAYFRMPPCPTKASPLADRLKHLLYLARRCSARGVIFNLVKFCEPELFDLPGLQAGLKKAGLPSLVLETEAAGSGGGQLATRLEAFAEIIN